MQNVTPFDVGKVTDYSKLVEQFGSTPIEAESKRVSAESKRVREEQKEWRTKYNPKLLKLGMVPPDAFVDLNDEDFFKMIRERVDNFEKHIGEPLPMDFRKYIVYCGPMFFNWSCCGMCFASF